MITERFFDFEYPHDLSKIFVISIMQSIYNADKIFLFTDTDNPPDFLFFEIRIFIKTSLDIRLLMV